jgi:ABC-type transporter Mla MlaB component
MAAPPSSTITFAIRGPLSREDLPALYRRVCILLEQSGATVAVCEVSDVAADAVSVDALARLQLAARRHRCQVQLRNASSELRDLIEFMGLDDVLVDESR